MIIECNCCGRMHFETLTADNITNMFVCKRCDGVNEYPFNIYDDSEYDDIVEYLSAKKSVLEFEAYFSNI